MGVSDRQSGRHGLCLYVFILRGRGKPWQAEVDVSVCARNGFKAMRNDNARELEL
jgi:hypothetical protein